MQLNFTEPKAPDDSVYERDYPHGALTRLHGLLTEVCPCRGAGPSIGRWDDRSTWRCVMDGEASEDQIAAAEAVMDAFDPWALDGAGAADNDARDDDGGEEEEDENRNEVFDHGTSLSESADEHQGGVHGPESMVYSDDSLAADEPALDDARGDVGEEEIIAPPDDPDPSDAVDEPDPANSGGVLIRELGDALTTAKAIALMAVDDERFNRVGDYDKGANQTRLDELRAIQQAIREGVHPAFTDEQTEELQALETFLPFMQRIDDHAQGLRNAIREAGDLEVLTSIDIISNWPE